MQFATLEYLLFVIGTLGIYKVAPTRWRPSIVLASSYYFYSTWGTRLLVFLIVSTAISYATGRALESVQTAWRRPVFITSLGLLLAVFLLNKYLWGGSSFNFSPSTTGISSTLTTIGLAFYTFEALSYITDVYRREVQVTRSPVDHAVFIAFFPHLLAGPVLRAGRFIPELHRAVRDRSSPALGTGSYLILSGFFKKIVLADPVFELASASVPSLDTHSTVEVWFLVIASIIAAYFDISAYIDIARGSAYLFNIHLQPNFAQPLTRSTSWSNFWRRWQITIMMWFRDYVYRPIRSTQRGQSSEALPIVGTFLAVGLWHGISIMWLAWSALVAGVLIAELSLRGTVRRRFRVQSEGAGFQLRVYNKCRELPRPIRRVSGVLYILVILAVINPIVSGMSGEAMSSYYRQLVSFDGVEVSVEIAGALVVSIAALLIIDRSERRFRGRDIGPLTLSRSVGLGVMLGGLIVMSGTRDIPFIYFAF